MNAQPRDRFQPQVVPPVNLGPIRGEQVQPAQPVRPMDEYLSDLYQPARPTMLIANTEVVEPQESRFPLAMWGWAVWTFALALLAIVLILFV